MKTKRAYKQDRVKKRVVFVPQVPKGSLFFFGKVGAGKTTAMLTIAQRYHDYRNLKIFDMWGGERNQGENLYWIIPSQFERYWKYWEKNIRLDKVGPKQYRVNLLYPLFKKLPKRLPYLEEKVFPVVFRIPIKTISTKMIKCVIGNLSSTNETLWNNAIDKLKKTDGIPELIKFFQKEGATNTSIYRDFVKPLSEHGLLCSMDDPMALDVGAEMRDKDTISVFAHHHVPEKFNVFILDWFLVRIWELSKVGKVSKDIIPIIREASKFFRASDRSVLEDKYKIFKKHLDDFLRYSRGKMHPFLDTQSPEETKGFLDGNQDLSVIGLLPGRDDRQFATEQFKRDGSMVTSQIKELAELEPGDYYFVEGRGKLARKRHLILPRTMYWREKDPPFYDIWERLRGKHAFKDSSGIYKKVKMKDKEKLAELNKIEKEEREKRRKEREEKEKRNQEIEEKKKLERKLELYEEEKREKKKIREKLKKENKTNKKVKMMGDSEEVIEESHDSGDFGEIFSDE